jgi:hypothetical protein
LLWGGRRPGQRGDAKPKGKPVFHIEYTEESMAAGPVRRSENVQGIDKSKQCLEGDRLGPLMSTTIKAVNLDGWVQYCDGQIANTTLVKGEVVKGLAKECPGK